MDYNIVSPELELCDPTPNIWDLFKQFDTQFFEEVLTRNCVELSWSPRMTTTAGLCAWNPRTNYCSIKLSLPLLQLRPRKDLVETLIHEMIHGFLFVTHQDDNHESHGDKFHYHMYRINQMTGTNITVYHTFHDEVRNYQNHVWRCTGPCQNWRPYYGYVKRAMNRAPGPNDSWHERHKNSCGGLFVKIKEPDQKTKPTALAMPSSQVSRPKTQSRKQPEPSPASQRRISDFMQTQPSTSRAPATSNVVRPPTSKLDQPERRAVPLVDLTQPKPSDYWSSVGPGQRLGGD